MGMLDNIHMFLRAAFDIAVICSSNDYPHMELSTYA